jgi:hypothetical protein
VAVDRLALDVEDRRQARPGAARLVDGLEDLRDALALRGSATSFSSKRRAPSWFGATLTICSSRSSAPTTSSRWLAAARRAGTPAPAPRVGREADARPQQVLEVAPALARRVVAVQRAVRAQIRASSSSIFS